MDEEFEIPGIGEDWDTAKAIYHRYERAFLEWKIMNSMSFHVPTDHFLKRAFIHAAQFGAKLASEYYLSLFAQDNEEEVIDG